jgi:hypothetical protein
VREKKLAIAVSEPHPPTRPAWTGTSRFFDLRSAGAMSLLADAMESMDVLPFDALDEGPMSVDYDVYDDDEDMVDEDDDDEDDDEEEDDDLLDDDDDEEEDEDEDDDDL